MIIIIYINNNNNYNNMNVNDILDKLPDDIKEFHILPHLKDEVKVWLKKDYYLKYHSVIKTMIPTMMYNSYVRDIIRHDCSFVFNKVVEENFERWLNIKKYKYEDIYYLDYVKFVNEYCIKNNANKCKIILNDKIEKAQLSKKWHKNKGNKNIRWSN